MSATIQTIITCDGHYPCCSGNDWSADSSHKSAREQRLEAHVRRGWVSRNGKDYCRECWQHMFSKKASKP